MKFLIRKKGSNQKAHYWNGKDTVCRLWSTGGMNRHKTYLILKHTDGKQICTMCKNVKLKEAYRFDRFQKRLAVRANQFQ